MKVYRHTNGCLYSIEQVGRGRTITPNPDSKKFMALPYRTNMDAPELPTLGETPDLTNFTHEFTE